MIKLRLSCYKTQTTHFSSQSLLILVIYSYIQQSSHQSHCWWLTVPYCIIISTFKTALHSVSTLTATHQQFISLPQLLSWQSPLCIRDGTHYSILETGDSCTVMEKSSAPFSLGGDNLKWYFDQRYTYFKINLYQWFINAQEGFLLVHLKKRALPLIEIPLQLFTYSNENRAELISMIVHNVSKWVSRLI